MTVKEFRAFLHRTGLTADWLGDERPVMEKDYYLVNSAGDTKGEIMKAVVTIKVTPNELQYLSAALECYLSVLRGDKPKLDLTAAEMNPNRAVTVTHKLLGDLDLK